MDPDQIRSSLIRVHSVCFHGKITLNALEYAAEVLSSQLFLAKNAG